MVRQIADETDCIAEQHPSPLFQMPLPGARVESGEEFILDIDAGSGQSVHQRTLAGVGVADQRYGMLCAPATDFAFFACLDFNQATAQIANPLIDQAAVFFQLGFAGAAQADAARDPRQVGPHAPQTRQGVFQLGQLHLQTCLGRPCSGRKDVQDHLAAIEDLDLGGFFQITHLSRG